MPCHQFAKSAVVSEQRALFPCSLLQQVWVCGRQTVFSYIEHIVPGSTQSDNRRPVYIIISQQAHFSFQSVSQSFFFRSSCSSIQRSRSAQVKFDSLAPVAAYSKQAHTSSLVMKEYSSRNHSSVMLLPQSISVTKLHRQASVFDAGLAAQHTRMADDAVFP